MEEKNTGAFLAMDIILAVVFMGFLLVIFNLSGKFFMAHIVLFAFMLIIAFIALIGIFYNLRWGWLMITFVASLIVLDELFIYLATRLFGIIFLVSFVSALLGLIYSLSNIKQRKETSANIEEEKIESIEKIEKAEKQSAKKFLGKKTGKTYHDLNCAIGKRIKSADLVWFKSMEEAASKGYVAHNCVKA